MTLRVLHVVSGDVWAGAEVATFHLIQALANRSDVHVRLLALNEGILTSRLRQAGIEVDVVAEKERPFVELVRSVRSLARSADVVHAHGYKEDLLAACSGRRWVSTQHGRPEPSHGIARVRMTAYLSLDRWVRYFFARRIIAVSTEVETWVARRLGTRRTVRIWNGITDPREEVIPERWGQRPYRVGSVARLYPVKALDLAIDAVAACRGVELEIVGEGPERNSLERRIIERSAANRIRVVGFESRPFHRVARWRALLVTSLHEGNPVSVLEALGLGTPILYAQLPGVDEILGGAGGWDVGSRDPAVWTRTIEALIGDEMAGEAASQAARRRYEAKFRASAAAERVLAVYRATVDATASEC